MSTKYIRTSERITELQNFVKKNNCMPSVYSDNKTEKQLAIWCRHTKFTSNNLSDAHYKKLAAIPGWKWTFRDERDFLIIAKKFDIFTKTHLRLPKNTHDTPLEEKTLYMWRKKVMKNFNQLTPLCQEKIHSITYWTDKDFTESTTSWEDTYFRYSDFVLNNKRPPFTQNKLRSNASVKTVAGENDLASWADLQRINYRKNKLEESQIYLLNRIPFWFWRNEDKPLYDYNDFTDQLYAWMKLCRTVPNIKSDDTIEHSLAVFAKFYELTPENIICAQKKPIIRKTGKVLK